MTNVRSLVWAAILVTIFTTACAKENSVQPPKDIHESFRVEQTTATSNGDLAVDKYLVGIRKAALEKEFLMRAEMLSQELTPGFQGLRSRIIAFRQHGDELLMLEATKGHVIDNNVPATLLLAKFKIAKEENGILYFDFNEGFQNLYTTADWAGSDYPSQDTLFQSVPLQLSYIDEARFDSQNQLIVSQVGQLRMATADGALANSPIKAKFYFSVYQPDPAFNKVDMGGDFNQFGFFEVNPLIGDQGRPVSYATHFSISKPVIYAVSANTPADFKDAVREGILYWNKAFGREVIKVVDAPADGNAPNSEMNVVQWVNWDWAGSAYADAQMDPRTGQTMHAQVFMTSVFAIGGKAAARRLIQQINNRPVLKAKQIGLKGFAVSTTCNRTHERALAANLSSLLSNPSITDQDVLRAGQDYVRDVVAHEVGHTLGLRHNFAGSLHANFKPSDHERLLKEYFVNKTVDPNLIATSSVMDYDMFTDAILTGHQIKAARSAMPYDEMAIRRLYDGINYSRAEVPPFCTDSHMAKMFDCLVWDSGPSTLESITATGNKAWDEIFDTLMRAFVSAKAPAPGVKAVPLEQVAFDAAALARDVSTIRGGYLTALNKDIQFLSINRGFNVVDSTNAKLVETKKLDYVKQELDRLGGMLKVMAPKSEKQLQDLLANVDAKINSGNYDKGIDQSNNTYQFTAAEIEIIRLRSKEVIEKVYSALPELEQKTLTEWKAELPDHALSDEYADVLQGRVEEWLLATTGQTLTGDVALKKGKVIQVTVPVFKYKHAIRKAAFALFTREGAPSVVWAYSQKQAVKAQFAKMIEKAFGGKFGDVKVESLNRDLLRWYLENAEILGAIGGGGEAAAADKKSPMAVSAK